MKKIISVCLFLTNSAVSILYAQESIIPQINYNQLEKYIQSAQENYPRKQILAVTTERAKNNIPMASVSYLDIFNASYIYRPDDAAALNPVNPYVFNGFQLGVNLNIGNFLQKPYEVRRARAEFKIAQLEEQEYEAVLTNEVKSRYYNYIFQLNQLKLKTQSAADNKNVSEDQRNKYEKGEITLQGYNTARINASDAGVEKLKAETDYLKAKDALEEIIGKKLEQIN